MDIDEHMKIINNYDDIIKNKYKSTYDRLKNLNKDIKNNRKEIEEILHAFIVSQIPIQYSANNLH